LLDDPAARAFQASSDLSPPSWQAAMGRAR
jgi:hypothetical protein